LSGAERKYDTLVFRLLTNYTTCFFYLHSEVDSEGEPKNFHNKTQMDTVLLPLPSNSLSPPPTTQTLYTIIFHTLSPSTDSAATRPARRRNYSFPCRRPCCHRRRLRPGCVVVVVAAAWCGERAPVTGGKKPWRVRCGFDRHPGSRWVAVSVVRARG
jgi:hypothetical protein